MKPDGNQQGITNTQQGSGGNAHFDAHRHRVGALGGGWHMVLYEGRGGRLFVHSRKCSHCWLSSAIYFCLKALRFPVNGYPLTRAAAPTAIHCLPRGSCHCVLPYINSNLPESIDGSAIPPPCFP